MKENIVNTSDSSKETRNVFIGAKVTPTQKEHIKSLAGQCGMTVSDYLLSCAYNFKPKARLTKEEAALLQNLDDCLVIAIIAGIAYCVSNLPIGSVPNTNGEFCFAMPQRYGYFDLFSYFCKV